MLWPETKQVRFDCLPRSRHLLHNQKFLCNLMRQGEHEVQSCCGNGVMIHLRPESKLAMLCREHRIHGDEIKQQKGHTSMAEVDFIKSHQNRLHPLCHPLGARSSGHSEAAWGFCFIGHRGNMMICESEH